MAIWRNRWQLISGAVLPLGIFQTWIAADVLVGLFGYPFRRPNIALWIVILIPVFTGLWSDDPLACVLWGWRIFALQSLVRNNAGAGKWFIIPAAIGLLIQAAFAFDVWLDHRPLVFSLNSEIMAAIGFAAFAPGALSWTAGVLTMGVAGARLTPALLVLLCALIAVSAGRFRSRQGTLRFRVEIRWHAAIPAALAAAVVCAMFAIQALAISPQRLTVATLKGDAAVRSDLVTLNNIQSVKAAIDVHRPDLSARPVERKWLPYGYGFRSYVERTAASTPHNIYILAWYELGLLAIPFFAALLWLGLRLPFPLLICLALYAGFVDLWYWHAAGIYGLAILAYNYSRMNGSTVPSVNTSPLS